MNELFLVTDLPAAIGERMAPVLAEYSGPAGTAYVLQSSSLEGAVTLLRAAGSLRRHAALFVRALPAREYARDLVNGSVAGQG